MLYPLEIPQEKEPERRDEVDDEEESDAEKENEFNSEVPKKDVRPIRRAKEKALDQIRQQLSGRNVAAIIMPQGSVSEQKTKM
ncbi:MAG: hypothetical protein GY696_30030 [Gammaproteobacteria bacterium]|nr:hypothetical protein [Gammaproteobacteria bacterium]